MDSNNWLSNYEFIPINNNNSLIKNFLSIKINPLTNYSDNIISFSSNDFKNKDILDNIQNNDDLLELDFEIEGKMNVDILKNNIINDLNCSNYLQNNLKNDSNLDYDLNNYFINNFTQDIFNSNIINVVKEKQNNLFYDSVDNLYDIKTDYENNFSVKNLDEDIKDEIHCFNNNFLEKNDVFEEVILYKDFDFKNTKNKENKKIEKIEKNINNEDLEKPILVDKPIDMEIVSKFFKNRKFAKEYSFKPDDFQMRSFYHIEKKENVFVAAHTSSGKTCVAEYAIAKAFMSKSKTIYTSPIKALSNQKFKEFSLIFDDVGIITGDICFNPNAKCLIMTTEILRNMLFSQSHKIWDVEWVIFDEVHYINNEDRGVIWEETIIMLPKHINLIMLSASVENVKDFINWVVKTTKKSIFLQKTNNRAVPLNTELFYNEMILLKEGDKKYNQTVYMDFLKKMREEQKKKMKKNLEHKAKLQETKNKWMQLSRQKERIRKITGKKLKSQEAKFILKNNLAKEKTNINDKSITSLVKLINKLKKDESLPIIIFDFSKKSINNLSSNLMGQLNLIDAIERKKIMKIFNLGLQTIEDKDERNVPQILKLKEMLKKGIAIHHGDLLNVCKEVVEMLFSKGLIKILIATDSFAMGLNMPSRSVIFKKIRKFDGNSLRLVNGGELMQMSGRAGRRGIDKIGRAIIFIGDESELPENADLFSLLNSKGETIESKFKITYSSLINYLGSNNFKVENILKKSLGNSNELNKFNEILQEYEKVENLIKEEHKNFNNKYYNNDNVDNKFEIFLKEIENMKKLNIFNSKIINKTKIKNIYGYVFLDNKIIPFRFSKKNYTSKKINFGFIFANLIIPFGTVIDEFQEDIKKTKKNINIDGNSYVFLENCNLKMENIFILFNFESNDKETDILYKFIKGFKSDKIKFHILEDILKKLNYENNEKTQLLNSVNLIFDKISEEKDISSKLNDYNKILKINIKLKNVENDLNNKKRVYKLDECENRLNVLKDLNYITKENYPLLKIKISKMLKGTSESLIITEIITSRLLNNLSPEEIPAFFSIILEKTRNSDEIKIEDLDISENLCNNIYQLENIFINLNDLEIKYNLDISNNFNLFYIENIIKWCNGYNLAQIVSEEDNDLLEGMLSRMILRVEQLINKILEVIKYLKQQNLQNKLSESILKLRKGIIFNKSWYLNPKFIKL